MDFLAESEVVESEATYSARTQTRDYRAPLGKTIPEDTPPVDSLAALSSSSWLCRQTRRYPTDRGQASSLEDSRAVDSFSSRADDPERMQTRDCPGPTGTKSRAGNWEPVPSVAPEVWAGEESVRRRRIRLNHPRHFVGARTLQGTRPRVVSERYLRLP